MVFDPSGALKLIPVSFQTYVRRGRVRLLPRSRCHRAGGHCGARPCALEPFKALKGLS